MSDLMRNLVVTLALLLTIAGCRRSDETASTATAPTTASSTSTTAPAAAPAVPQQAATTRLDVGSMMPADYTALELDGTKFEMSSKQDKVLLVNLWATWCGPCRYEIPELQAIHDRYKDKGFEVLGISLDETGADVVKPFVEEQKMTYPVLLDPKGELADMLETSVLPTTILVDRTGKITWKKLGAVMPNDPEIEVAIKSALGLT